MGMGCWNVLMKRCGDIGVFIACPRMLGFSWIETRLCNESRDCEAFGLSRYGRGKHGMWRLDIYLGEV